MRTELLLISLLFTASFTALCTDVCRASEPRLYDRLGGEVTLRRITSQLIDRVSQHDETRRSFHKVDLKRVKDKLYEQLCQLSGGPCTYTGDPMKPVHQGLKITEREFYAMVQQLRDILDAEAIAAGDKNALLALLAPMKSDVVMPQ